MQERIIVCTKCGGEMTRGQLNFVQVTAVKGKGFFDGTAQSTVSCYVCPECGYCELYADKYKEFKK